MHTCRSLILYLNLVKIYLCFITSILIIHGFLEAFKAPSLDPSEQALQWTGR